MAYRIVMIIICFMAVMLPSCGEKQIDNPVVTFPVIEFNADSIGIPDGGVPKVRGQVLYMPVYSNIPHTSSGYHDLSAFLAVHNTDIRNSIKITKVILFNTDGKAVKDYLPSSRELAPLATAVFILPKQDQSGPGANFLVSWESVNPVTAPLAESVMKDQSGNMGLSFLSTGKVIREIK